MILIAFDFQGVFRTRTGIYQTELFTFLSNPHKEICLAIISNLSHQTLVRELQYRHVPLNHISIYGYEDMESKAAAVIELQQTWQPSHTLFITDTVRDIVDVGRTSATILAVSWGIDSSEDLQAVHPHGMISSVPQLLTHIQSVITV